MKEIKLKGLDEIVYHDVCDNGLPIYIWVNKKVNTFKASYVISCGSEDIEFKIDKKDEKVPFGTAHYLEHLMCKQKDGSPLLGAFNQLGCYSNASTYADRTVFEFVGSVNFKENLELLLDCLYQKEFVLEHVEAERGPILEERRMRKDDIGRISLYGLNNNLFETYPNRVTGLGEESDILNITLDDVKKLYDVFYHPKNSYLVVTGNVSPTEVIHIVNENQKHKKYCSFVEPKKKKYREPKMVVKKSEEIYANVEVPVLYLATKIPCECLKGINELVFLDVINVVLVSNFGETSLFKENLIEKKLALTLGASAYLERDYIVIKVSSRTKYPEQLLPVLTRKMKRLLFQEQDIMRKVKAEIANLVLGYEDPENVNDMICYCLSHYKKIVDNEKEILENISMDMIHNVFDKLSFKEKTSLIIYPLKDKKESISY